MITYGLVKQYGPYAKPYPTSYQSDDTQVIAPRYPYVPALGNTVYNPSKWGKRQVTEMESYANPKLLQLQAGREMRDLELKSALARIFGNNFKADVAKPEKLKHTDDPNKAKADAPALGPTQAMPTARPMPDLMAESPTVAPQPPIQVFNVTNTTQGPSQTIIDRYEQSLAEKDATVASLKETKKALEDEFASNEMRASELESKLKEAQSAIISRDEMMKAFTEEHRKKMEQLYEATSKLSTAEQNLAITEEMIEEFKEKAATMEAAQEQFKRDSEEEKKKLAQEIELIKGEGRKLYVANIDLQTQIEASQRALQIEQDKANNPLRNVPTLISQFEQLSRQQQAQTTAESAVSIFREADAMDVDIPEEEPEPPKPKESPKPKPKPKQKSKPKKTPEQIAKEKERSKKVVEEGNRNQAVRTLSLLPAKLEEVNRKLEEFKKLSPKQRMRSAKYEKLLSQALKLENQIKLAKEKLGR